MAQRRPGLQQQQLVSHEGLTQHTPQGLLGISSFRERNCSQDTVRTYLCMICFGLLQFPIVFLQFYTDLGGLKIQSKYDVEN